MKIMTTELFLIRHAQTEYNNQRRYCGSLDAPLNKAGITQVESLRFEVLGLKLDVLFCSPLKRTKQTANILFPKKKIIFEPLLRELNFGKWEGMKFDEIREKHGNLYEQWINDPFNNTPPEGERLVDLEERCMKFLNSVLENYKNKKIGIVSHGGPIKMILLNVNNVGKKGFWSIEVKNASLHKLRFKDKQLIIHKVSGE